MVLFRATLLTLLFATPALAADAPASPPPEPSAPQSAPPKAQAGKRLGGHVGFGLPILSVSGAGTGVIFRDFGALGIVTGLNVGFDEHWSIDMELIVIADFMAATRGISQMTFVLDPGVIYNFGPLWAGLRLALRVPAPLGGAEFGFIPIIGKGFELMPGLAYYVELDLPMFIHAPGNFSFNIFIQTGIGF